MTSQANNDALPLVIDTSRPTHNTAPTQFVEVDGTRFAYRRFGFPLGTPIVLLSASAGSVSPAGQRGSGAGRGSRRPVQSSASTASPASAAASVSFTTSAGWETIARCPDATSAVVAPMRLANMR